LPFVIQAVIITQILCLVASALFKTAEIMVVYISPISSPTLTYLLTDLTAIFYVKLR